VEFKKPTPHGNGLTQSQQPSTHPYYVPDKSSPSPHILILKDQF